MIRQKRPNSSSNFGEKPLQFSAKTFSFLVFIQFRRRNHAIFTKVLSHAKWVWSGLQKRPPMQNFTIDVLIPPKWCHPGRAVPPFSDATAISLIPSQSSSQI